MKQNLSYSLFVLLFTFFLIGNGQAQVRIAPLTQTPPQSASKTNSARIQAVNLPFFDDFSTYLGQPDPALWINGGTFVNNTFDDNPPSKGYATFDGLKANGAPYSAITTITSAATDTLTSQPINLSNPPSTVLMSFWWSAKSLGESPDPADSLILEFKDATGNWVRQWGDTARDKKTFRDTVLVIGQSRFLHGDFQFRFRSFGRPSGMYDIWNLDFVVISTTANYNNGKYLSEVAATRQPKSVLKRYSAMPLDQFLANPTAELGGRDSVYVYNQFDGQVSGKLPSKYFLFNYIYTIVNKQKNQEIYRYNLATDGPKNGKPTSLAVAMRSSQMFSDNPNANPDVGRDVTIPNTLSITGTAPLILQSQFKIDPTLENTDFTIPTIDLTRNDTVGRATILSDYYAYDDATAEYGIGLRQRQGSVAVRYILNKPDTLTAVNILFVHTTDKDLTGQTFVLKVWKKLDAQATSVLYKKSFIVQYPTQLNKFYTYNLEIEADTVAAPIAVSDTIYVGWTQVTNDLLAVGYDRNSDSRQQQFYDISGGSQWQPNTEPQAGSIMIRPVFGSGVVTGIEPNAPPEVVANFKTYPNPAQNTLHWNQEGVRNVRIQDMLGRTLRDQSFALASSTKQISFSDLPNGMYIFSFQLNQYRIVRKIVVNR